MLDLMAAIAAGDEALDRGVRGASVELGLLHDAGLLAAPLPVDRGGKGWGTSAAGAEPMLTLLSSLGAASLPVARLYEGHVNAIKLVLQHGDRSQGDNVCAAVKDGSLLGVWGAERERPVTIGANRVLDGAKSFASGLGDVKLAIVTAHGPDGLQMVMADATDPARADFVAWDVDAMVGSRSGGFDCSGLSAYPTDCIGGGDALFVEPNFHGGLWRLSACYAGAMDQLARSTTNRLDGANMRGDPVAAQRIGQLAMEATGAGLWARSACLAVETGTMTPTQAVTAALLAREAIEQAAIRLLSIVERVHGTSMHRRGSPIGRMARDLRFYLRQADLDGKLRLAAEHWYIDGR